MYQWTLKAFNDLSPAELYALLRLRSEVFVVEQNCVFLDMDDADAECYHLMGWTSAARTATAARGLCPYRPSRGQIPRALYRAGGHLPRRSGERAPAEPLWGRPCRICTTCTVSSPSGLAHNGIS